MMKIRHSFTFAESVGSFMYQTNIQYWNGANLMDSQTPLMTELMGKFIQDIDDFVESPTTYLYLFPNIFKQENNQWILTSNVLLDLLNGIMARYEQQYFISVDEDYRASDFAIDVAFRDAFKKRWTNFLRYINDSCPKYLKILEIYEANKSKLMDQLESSVEASAGTKGTSRYNDTPQEHPSTFDEFADADYTTDITISNSDTESEQTTKWDDANVMKRISEIQDSYQNWMKRWIGEFDKFFWEE